MPQTDPEQEAESVEASEACACCGQPLDRPQCAICAEYLPVKIGLCPNAGDGDHDL